MKSLPKIWNMDIYEHVLKKLLFLWKTERNSLIFFKFSNLVTKNNLFPDNPSAVLLTEHQETSDTTFFMLTISSSFLSIMHTSKVQNYLAVYYICSLLRLNFTHYLLTLYIVVDKGAIFLCRKNSERQSSQNIAMTVCPGL